MTTKTFFEVNKMYIWNMAADIYGFSDKQIENAVYANPEIERFINAKDSMGISGCKGMGKTFLLKAKRMMAMRDSSYFILPQNQLVDTPGPIILNHSQIKFLSSYQNWVSLWVFCISAYILSQDEFSDIRNGDDYSFLSRDIVKIIDSKNDGVFHVLSRLLANEKIEMLRTAISCSSLLFQLLQRINRQVVVFVDKIEEPFNRGYYKIAGSTDSAEGKYNASIWAYSQLSFAEAVYMIYSGRHHIKIFYSIRQEALYGGERISIEFSKIRKEMISTIEYDYYDLKKMFEKYIALESEENLYDFKNKDPYMALCGISKIKHRSGKIESLWAYLYRHSLGRPRDIMEMGICLYNNVIVRNKNKKMSRSERVRACRHWTNQIATRICKEHIHVLEPFLSFEDNIVFSQKLEVFLSLLPTNVFTKESTIKYCHLANFKYGKNECVQCDCMHFFSTLYNIGLLGYIYKNSSEDGYKNSIKSLGDSIFDTTSQSLPDGVLYYVHPGVGNMIQETREKNMQKYENSNIVINSSEVFIDEKQLLHLEHLSAALLGNLNEKRVFITSTERHMKNEREQIIKFLKSRGYEVMAFEDPGFPKMSSEKHGEGATHDHCIDVALSCGSLIYIFDGDYGGKYAGKDYESYIEENQNVIQLRPSVSFMEYLVAKTYKKNVLVYVLNAVDIARGEYLANGKPTSYASNVVEKKHEADVFTQLGYFNALGNGTWYNKYSSISDLEKYLEVAFPKLT